MDNIKYRRGSQRAWLTFSGYAYQGEMAKKYPKGLSFKPGEK